MDNKLTRKELPDVMTVKHVQQFLGIGRRQSYEMMENPPFNVVRIGKIYKISKVSFLRWLDGEDRE
ncbi:helix-turn-helix domain-containing protein [Rossellomorea sp. DA94]|uniref:helix-turn-helix domain-containing protein n=1 Tax=Rossellomorea sp. DA94 TaxID=3038653 RepID=UPI00244C621D|nr:helix-turn-helix domain-containing protein [Rossellomorea sp. DA94]WGG47705.1 helix-turn-helix domain-containing protein [Rossellomorea sp. DA94]